MHRLMLRMWIVAAIVVTVGAGSVFSQTPAQPANPDLAPAIKLLREEEIEKAVDLLKQAVKLNKLDGEAWYYLGIGYLQLSDFKKASEAFKRAIEVRPDLAAPAHAGYAYSLVLRNNLDHAVAEANKALESDAQNIEALYTLAIVDLRKGAREEAVRKAERISALKPDFAAAYLLKSQALVVYGGAVAYANPADDTREERQLRYRSAAQALEKYLELESDSRAVETWKEQLETLKFLLADKSVRGEVYTGREVSTKVKLIAKPEPVYTERARSQSIQGTVVLRCVFMSDGTVKHILVMQALAGGLTERAIAAAKQIKFVPATRDGKPVSTWMQLEYNFNLF